MAHPVEPADYTVGYEFMHRPVLLRRTEPIVFTVDNQCGDSHLGQVRFLIPTGFQGFELIPEHPVPQGHTALLDHPGFGLMLIEG